MNTAQYLLQKDLNQINPYIKDNYFIFEDKGGIEDNSLQNVLHINMAFIRFINHPSYDIKKYEEHEEWVYFRDFLKFAVKYLGVSRCKKSFKTYLKIFTDGEAPEIKSKVIKLGTELDKWVWKAFDGEIVQF